jgi:hypothetical protein
MYRFVCARISVVVMAFTFFLCAWGQFHDASKEELQMTADPNAPGADAVFLYHEDSLDSLGGTRTFYERVKILTEKGLEKATKHTLYISRRPFLGLHTRRVCRETLMS